MAENKFYVKEEGAAFQGFEAAEKKSSSKARVLIMFLLLFLFIGGLLVAGYFYMKQKQQSPAMAKSTPTVVPSATPTVASSSATPALSGSVTPSGKLTGTPGPSSTSAKKSSISIAVLNGSGTAHAAQGVASYLKSLGYVTSTGNASTFDYTNITIQVKKGATDTLSLLKADLGKQYTVGSTSTSLPTSNTTDAVVIVGK